MSDMTEQAGSSADFAEHQHTFDSVMRMALIAILHVLSILVGLAIGGVDHHWSVAGFWMVIATIAAGLGAALKELSWRPGAVILVVMLATLGMVSAG
ncbi:aa3-type cytochrome c oxidase subunit IV [Labrys wisconsinensis]|uniref:Cytochrome c oxidase subunit IV bacterial aa3 type domain-containing protein n=1 Tax=Labrys wisconsinensis TaxID=425677 RepID=A0ABU0JIV1_9HYPH|nr:aa3-type cytochrome c oxidase subunit IV [Labrys wisconsinensis]MDQ0474216.1 hypothetical protein [Labrys wisconsinensis]